MEELDTLAVGLAQIHRPGRNPEFDAIASFASRQCNHELSKLRKTLGALVQDLSPPSRRKRGMGALNSTLKKPHIEAMRSSLEKVKSTLLIVKVSSVE